MLIEQAILTKLLATSGLTDLIGERIYYVKAPQDVGIPYVVFFKVSGAREHSHDGASGLARPRFQFSCFSETYYEAKQIAEQIQSALQAYSGTMGGAGGVEVGASFYDNETDMYEEDTKLYHIAVDYMISHEE
jgi:hypothetical protein